ncbi:MAG: glycosyltransferase family 9 protein [Nitrospina sp.]|jgi:ADP-heptose:LPS heptosyltransferase|nr:glycosyltransferase family 9 protein [Nitrospina sp.]
MKLKFMRDVDILLGGFIINILNLFFIFRFNKKKPNPPRERVKNILVIKFFGLGSILMMTPALRGLKALYPNGKIHLLTFERNYKFCLKIKCIDHILTLSPKSFWEFSIDVLRNLVRVWSIRPTVVVDAEFFSNFTSLLSLLSFSKVRVGYHLRQVARGKSLTHQVYLNTHHHVNHVFYSLVAALGAKYEDIKLNDINLDIPHSGDIESCFKKLNVPEHSQIVVVNPNASDMSSLRRWPASHFVVLISELANKYPENSFVFVGNEQEKQYVENITQKIKLSNVISSAGLLDIDEYCGLLYSSNLIITNDSLPTHIASAYNKDVVVFFGPETPEFYGPLTSNSICFFENIPCSPCLIVFDNKAEVHCQDNICLKQLSPEKVIKSVEEKFFQNEPILIHKN